MQKLKRTGLSRQQVDLLLISAFFVAAILITIIFRVNENIEYHQALK